MVDVASARILLVEDDEEMRRLVQEILEEEGYSVLPSPDTLEALVKLHGQRADVAIVDWRMPDVDGIGFLSSVRRSCPGMPVIFVTAFPGEEIRDRAFREGAFSFLPKPFRRADLILEVERALQASLAGGGGWLPPSTGDRP